MEQSYAAIITCLGGILTAYILNNTILKEGFTE
jgi:hypothetical protein